MRNRTLQSAVALACMTLCATLAAPAAADVELNPGTVTGEAGINAWTRTSTYASISANNNGFSGSASNNGASYAVTLEGGQTYNDL